MPEPPDELPPAPTAAEVTQARREVLDALPESTPVPKLDPQLQEHGRQTLVFRRVYGWVLLGALLFQVLMADVVFLIYASLGAHWNIPSAVISAWLASTVVEVIGVVYAITRSLFPLGDKGHAGQIKL